ncbi:hypothetical protein [Pedobacter sp. SYSU D00535]|uniref:hypothetical protein n=1 Tax=Pedobacter sp. SYSU D00535 TaxID=2810308 RepID=UPI001A96EEF4|nr:hypothetical protein [Pedobacter sp. SYSU D00535]
MRYCLTIAYEYPFLPKFYDEEIEAALTKVAMQIDKGSTATNPPRSNRVVFWDSHFLDNSGLTLQYVRALLKNGFEVLFIITSEKMIMRGLNLYEELSSNSNVTICVLPDSIDSTERIRFALYKIREFGPSKGFLHFTPWEIEGFCVFSTLDEVTRYFINLTDHAFWLGRKCSDYFFEFRNYGFYISKVLRDIPEEKLILLPFYPVFTKSNSSFQGFPFETADKIIGFGGGSLYKIYGDPDNTYLNAIKHVLERNKDFVFLFVAGGDERYLLKFIKENGLQKQFFYLRRRKDISAIFDNVHFYVDTYPMLGGLMVHYAVSKGVPLVGLMKPTLTWNSLSSFLNTNIVQSKASSQEFEAGIEELVHLSRQKGMNNRIEAYKNLIDTEQSFNLRFQLILNEDMKNNHHEIMGEFMDKDEFLSYYLTLENDYMKKFYSSKLSLLGQDALLGSLEDGLRTVAGVVVNYLYKKAQFL